MISIENLKALEPGKIYAIQLEQGVTNELVDELSERLKSIHEEFGLHFIVFAPGLEIIEICKTEH